MGEEQAHRGSVGSLTGGNPVGFQSSSTGRGARSPTAPSRVAVRAGSLRAVMRRRPIAEPGKAAASAITALAPVADR